MATVLQTTPFQRKVLTITMSLGTALVAMDMTIVGVVLPVMQGSLKASMEQMAWIITSYIVASAIMTPLSGALTAPFGRKTVYICSLACFAITSGLCGLATDLSQMVVFRTLQGISGAAIMPLSQSIIFDMYEQKDYNRAYGLFVVGALGGPVIGPVVGGFLTEFTNWRWAFFVNLPLVGAALLIVLYLMPSKGRIQNLKIDFLGFALLAIFVACLQLVLDRGVSEDWFSSTEIVLESLIGFGAFYFFVVHMFTHQSPFLNVALFTDSNYVSGLVVTFAASVALFAPIVLIPSFLQDLQGYTVIDAGLLLAPRGFGSAIAVTVIPILLKQFSARYVCLCGSFLILFSLYNVHHFNLEVGAGPVIYTGLIHGIGVGMIILPVSVLSLGSLPSQLRDQAAALFQLVRNLGSSIGIALAVTVMAETSDANLVDLYSFFTIFNSDAINSASGLLATDNPQGLFLLKMELIRQSRMIGFQNAFIVLIATSLIAIPFILSFRSQGESSTSRWMSSDGLKRLKAKLLSIFVRS